MRYTKREVKSMFRRLVKALEKQVVGSSFNTPTDEIIELTTGLSLDYISNHGGYVIEEIGFNGSTSYPFGCQRRSSREMYLSMYMTVLALEAIEHVKDQIKEMEW